MDGRDGGNLFSDEVVNGSHGSFGDSSEGVRSIFAGDGLGYYGI